MTSDRKQSGWGNNVICLLFDWRRNLSRLFGNHGWLINDRGGGGRALNYSDAIWFWGIPPSFFFNFHIYNHCFAVQWSPSSQEKTPLVASDTCPRAAPFSPSNTRPKHLYHWLLCLFVWSIFWFDLKRQSQKRETGVTCRNPTFPKSRDIGNWVANARVAGANPSIILASKPKPASDKQRAWRRQRLGVFHPWQDNL